MFQIFSKKYLGIDIGTSAIRIVELSSKKQLANYGEAYAKSINTPFIRTENNSIVLSENAIIASIKAILAEAKISTKKVFVSLADFSSFFTTIQMPKMNEREMENAVQFEAKKYIPIPLNNITLDWQIIEELPPSKEGGAGGYKVLIVAIANEIIDQYQRVIASCGLELMGFEAEVFSLARALMGNDRRATAIVDLGARSSTVTIVEEGVIKDSHSLDFCGEQIIAKLTKDLGLDYETARSIKDSSGIAGSDPKIREALMPAINLMVQESDRIFRNFNRNTGKNIERIVVSGGMVFMPGFMEYFARQFGNMARTEVANAFNALSFSPKLKTALEKMSPAFSIAVGLALKGTEI